MLLETRGESSSPFPSDGDTGLRWLTGKSRIQPRFRATILIVFYGTSQPSENAQSALATAWALDDRLTTLPVVDDALLPASRPIDLAAHAARSFTSLDEAWVGRSDRVSRLSSRLGDACRLLIIVGMPGIGNLVRSAALDHLRRLGETA